MFLLRCTSLSSVDLPKFPIEDVDHIGCVIAHIQEVSGESIIKKLDAAWALIDYATLNMSCAVRLNLFQAEKQFSATSNGCAAQNNTFNTKDG